MICSRTHLYHDVMNSRCHLSCGSRVYWKAYRSRWRRSESCIISLDVPNNTISHLSSLNVSRYIGRSRSTTLRATDHVTTKEQLAHFLEWVLGCTVDGKMWLLKAAVRSSKEAEMPGQPR